MCNVIHNLPLLPLLFSSIKIAGKRISRGRNCRSGRATDEIDLVRESSREDSVRKTKAQKANGAASEYAEDENLSNAVTKKDEWDWVFC